MGTSLWLGQIVDPLSSDDKLAIKKACIPAPWHCRLTSYRGWEDDILNRLKGHISYMVQRNDFVWNGEEIDNETVTGYMTKLLTDSRIPAYKLAKQIDEYFSERGADLYSIPDDPRVVNFPQCLNLDTKASLADLCTMIPLQGNLSTNLVPVGYYGDPQDFFTIALDKPDEKLNLIYYSSPYADQHISYDPESGSIWYSHHGTFGGSRDKAEGKIWEMLGRRAKIEWNDEQYIEIISV